MSIKKLINLGLLAEKATNYFATGDPIPDLSFPQILMVVDRPIIASARIILVWNTLSLIQIILYHYSIKR